MRKHVIKVERTLVLANQLMQDIKARGLKSGEHYFTTLEAAAFLGVAGASANRALILLEKRGVIARRQKTGAVIVNPEEPHPVIDQIHVFMNYRLSDLGDYGEGIIHGIHEEHLRSHITYSVLEPRNELHIVTKLLEQVGKSSDSHAFVMISSSPAVQKLVGGSRFPRVLLGSKCPGTPRVSQLDIHHEAALRMLVDYLRAQGRTRIAVLMRRVVQPGDVPVINTAMRLGVPNCFFLQHPENHDNCVDEIRELIQSQFDPNGVICLSSGYAEAYEAAMAKLGKSAAETEITAIYHRSWEQTARFTHTATQLSAVMQGRRLGQLLLDSALGFQPKREVVPMKLVLRGEESSATSNPVMPLIPDNQQAIEI